MRRHVTLVLALTVMLEVGGGAGCGSSIRVSSTIILENAPPIERLFVIADIKSPVFENVMYGGFHLGMTTALSMCHVEGRLVHKDPVGLDEEERLLRVLKELQPDAQLLITSTGGTLRGGKPSKRLFELELFVRASNELAWRADVVMEDYYYLDERAAGEDLAVHIISRLRADGLLKSCPSGELSRSRTSTRGRRP